MSDGTPDVEAQDWLYSADNKVLGCKGQRHDFPILRPGRSLPRGLRIEGPYHDGVMELVFTCRAGCGTVRRLVTAPAAQLDLPAMYRYKYHDAYKYPKGSGITKRDCLYETWRRAKEDLQYLLQEQQRARELAGLATTEGTS
jgi:hypothetical protein